MKAMRVSDNAFAMCPASLLHLPSECLSMYFFLDLLAKPKGTRILVADLKVSRACHFAKESVPSVRELLSQTNLIWYEKGSGNRPCLYVLTWKATRLNRGKNLALEPVVVLPRTTSGSTQNHNLSQAACGKPSLSVLPPLTMRIRQAVKP